MALTNNLSITLVEQAQAQKEVTVNTALTRIDALLNTGAKDKDLTTPPGSPATGDLYIVAAGPTGAWLGQAGKIAYFDQVWQFLSPHEGLTLWVNDEDAAYAYDGTNWRRLYALQALAIISSTTYMLSAGDDTRTLYFTNASAVALTLASNLPAGFRCHVIQGGAGQVTLTAASGAALHNRLGYYRTAGQYAVMTLTVSDNSSGVAAQYVLSGDGI